MTLQVLTLFLLTSALGASAKGIDVGNEVQLCSEDGTACKTDDNKVQATTVLQHSGSATVSEAKDLEHDVDATQGNDDPYGWGDQRTNTNGGPDDDEDDAWTRTIPGSANHDPTYQANCNQFTCPSGYRNTGIKGQAYDKATCCEACAGITDETKCTNDCTGYMWYGNKCQNQCTCTNGAGAIGSDCPEPGGAKCSACNPPYTLSGTVCKAWTPRRRVTISLRRRWSR